MCVHEHESVCVLQRNNLTIFLKATTSKVMKLETRLQIIKMCLNGKAVKIAGMDYFSKELGAQVKENDKDFSGGTREDQDKLCNINNTKIMCIAEGEGCWKMNLRRCATKTKANDTNISPYKSR